jgi:hypothetical protein
MYCRRVYCAFAGTFYVRFPRRSVLVHICTSSPISPDSGLALVGTLFQGFRVCP